MNLYRSTLPLDELLLSKMIISNSNVKETPDRALFKRPGRVLVTATPRDKSPSGSLFATAQPRKKKRRWRSRLL